MIVAALIGFANVVACRKDCACEQRLVVSVSWSCRVGIPGVDVDGDIDVIDGWTHMGASLNHSCHLDPPELVQMIESQI